MSVGRLLQPYVTLIWGEDNLSFFDDGEGGKQILAQNVALRLNKGESAPECTFNISPNPIGFELFTKLKKTALSKPFEVTFGYPKGTEFTQKFRFSGMQLTTGHDPMLQITGVSILKGPWTDNKISYTMEKEMTLKDFADFLKKKTGEGAKDLSFEWVGEAAEKASQYKVKNNQTQRTPHSILVDTLRPFGMDVQGGDSAFGGNMVISYAPNKDGELKKDKPTVNKGSAEPTPGQRTVYVIGPGLMENVTRKQSFNLGQTNTQRNSSQTSTVSDQTEQEGNVEKDTPQAAAAQSSNTEGTSGKSNPSTADSGAINKDKDAEEARKAFSKLLTSTVDLTVSMVPYIIGIKPRDIIVIPSLAGPGDFLEDWEVNDVSYSQDDNGGVDISISGGRTFTGEKSMLDASTEEEVREIVKGLTTPAKWNKFYWIQGPEVDYPLAS